MSTFLDDYKSLFVGEFLNKLYLAGSKVKDANLLCEQLKRLFDQAKSADIIMSKNEDLEDVSTSSLLFVLLPFAIGEIQYNHIAFNRETRVSVLKEVEQSLQEFIKMADQLRICGPTREGCEQREYRMAAIKRQDILKPSLLEVAGKCLLPNIDLDEIRDAVSATMEYFYIQSQHDMRFVKDEMDMLKNHTETAKEEPVKKPWSMKLDQTQLRTLINSRVFKPDINMPKMSLDEFARLEMEHMKANSTKNLAKQIDADTIYRVQEIEEENKLLKARGWDDWKDDNPRGIGNKMTNLG